MKTEDLNIIEAVRVLDEDKCEKIEDENRSQFCLDDRRVFVHCGGNSPCFTTQTLLGKWKLIGVRPVKKKIVLENVLWKEFTSGVVSPFNLPGIIFDWNDFLDKPKMKMTLEWEE